MISNLDIKGVQPWYKRGPCASVWAQPGDISKWPLLNFRLLKQEPLPEQYSPLRQPGPAIINVMSNLYFFDWNNWGVPRKMNIRKLTWTLVLYSNRLVTLLRMARATIQANPVNEAHRDIDVWGLRMRM